METAPTPSSPPSSSPFRGLERSVEHVLGADFRLVYGIAVPILMVIGLIILLALRPSTWLVVSVLLLEVAALAVVVVGFMGVLNDEDDEEPDSV